MSRGDLALPAAFKLSRAGYYADFVLAPVVAIVFLSVELLVEPRWSIVLLVAAGFVLWTFAEYLIHRFAFHGPLRAMHDVHHRRPAAYLGVASWGTWPLFALAWLGLCAIASVPAANALMSGLLLGYLAYIVVHDLIHHGDRARFGRVMRALFARHSAHHRGGHGAFGVITPLWDIVFRTYR